VAGLGVDSFTKLDTDSADGLAIDFNGPVGWLRHLFE
jgi:hypothetical protein